MQCSGIKSLDVTYLSALQWAQYHLQIQSLTPRENNKRKSFLNHPQKISFHFTTVYLHTNIFHAGNGHTHYLDRNVQTNSVELITLHFKWKNSIEGGKKHFLTALKIMIKTSELDYIEFIIKREKYTMIQLLK